MSKKSWQSEKRESKKIDSVGDGKRSGDQEERLLERVRVRDLIIVIYPITREATKRESRDT